jgi:hypothetical protein
LAGEPRAGASSPGHHVDQNRRDFDALYVDGDHDDRHGADESQTDADRMYDAIGDDFSAIVIPADLPRTYRVMTARTSREVVMTHGN